MPVGEKEEIWWQVSECGSVQQMMESIFWAGAFVRRLMENISPDKEVL